jgi:LCP family protein required for cell wall assembly
MIRDPRQAPRPDDDSYEDDDLFDDEVYDDDYLDDEAPVAPRRRSWAGPFLGVLLGIALSVGAIFAAATVTRAGGFSGASTFNVLVMGTDQRPDERGLDPGRTDSMMLVSIPRGGSGVSLVSIPRDLWVTIPRHGEGRINTAYRMGELEKPGGGPALAKETVGDALGVHVDRFVLVDMSGVKGIVDELGGIVVDNPETLTDSTFPTDDYGTKSVVIPAGRQQLDGDLALVYARTRHQDSDFGRMARQQQVIAAILAKLHTPDAALRLPALLGVVQRATRTDVSGADMTIVGPAALDLSGDKVHRLVIGPDLVTPLTGMDGAALLQPRPTLQKSVASFLTGSS